MTVKIVLPKPHKKGEPQLSIGTQVFNEHGSEITGITSIDISIKPDDIITATVEVYVDSETEIDNIHALLGTETLDQIAELHGLTLSKPDPKNKGIASIDFKVDCSEIDECKKILDLIIKYEDQLPKEMQKEIAALNG